MRYNVGVELGLTVEQRSAGEIAAIVDGVRDGEILGETFAWRQRQKTGGDRHGEQSDRALHDFPPTAGDLSYGQGKSSTSDAILSRVDAAFKIATGPNQQTLPKRAAPAIVDVGGSFWLPWPVSRSPCRTQDDRNGRLARRVSVMMRDAIRRLLTFIGTLTARPAAFLIVFLYAGMWAVVEPETLDLHGAATLATWLMTLFIQRAEHRDTQASRRSSTN